MSYVENPIPITLASTDGRTVEVRFGSFALTTEQAHAFAFALSHETALSENMPERHERHVDLKGECPLCVAEAGAQPDRLTFDMEWTACGNCGTPVEVREIDLDGDGPFYCERCGG